MRVSAATASTTQSSRGMLDRVADMTAKRAAITPEEAKDLAVRALRFVATYFGAIDGGRGETR